MQKRHKMRIMSFAVAFVVICLIFTARLINIQIASRDYYNTVSTGSYTRTVTIQAQRGEVFDCNSIPLIKNDYSYNILLDRGTLSYKNAEMNENLLAIYAKIAASDTEYTLNEISFPGIGQYPNYSVNESFFSSSSDKARFSRMLTNLEIEDIGTVIGKETHPYGLSLYDKQLSSNVYERMLYDLKATMNAGPTSVSLGDIIETLALRYGITDSDGNLNYDTITADFLLRLRYDMEARDFSALTPYTVATGADIGLITYLEEGSLRGFTISATAERIYCEPGIASHILGRTGKIQAADVEYYTELGYRLDAIVGRDGVELAFEEYLHGIDGTMAITEDEYGNIISQEITKAPVAGCDVYLTIDIDLQRAAETALEDNIEYIHQRAMAAEGELDGEDANAGAITVINVNTGAVLAIASNPTFDQSTYSENISELLTDEDSPLYNRALNGLYPPGSTFKPAVAAAALSENIVTPSTIIETHGEYRYYAESGYTPRCWLYLSNGKNHGPINISEAIQVSCNYFFYEIGRLLTIETMNRYCSAFGLGQNTGIELPEQTGVLAGPDYRQQNRLDAWNPGDTLAAAIGQSDNIFTPLQISVYMASVINRGVRYNSHILKCVNRYGTNELVYETPTDIMSSITISDANVATILNAMQTVLETGTVATLFDNYPIKVGGKTGTAQINPNHSDNAVFVGFAPFDNPEIVATCVIERGAKGAYAGMSVRDVFTEYFDFNTGNSSGDANDESNENGNNGENDE